MPFRQRQLEVKRAAGGGSAFDPKPAAHQFDQTVGDGEPEPGAAVLAGV
jgi:hypothetical protein